MAVNIGVFKDKDLTIQYSTDKEPYEEGYLPIFGDVVFNATDGDVKVVVVYLHEINEYGDYYYTDVEVSPYETAPYQRDPDQDEENEWHIFISKPKETTVTNEAVGVGDGSQTLFSLQYKWVKPGSEVITVGGQQKQRNVHYAINYSKGVINFRQAPPSGAQIVASYVHGDDGEGNVNIPTQAEIEENGDWTWTSVWDIPHGYDTWRGSGNEKDCIPVIIMGKVDPGTTDPNGNAITLWQQQIKVRGWEHNLKY